MLDCYYYYSLHYPDSYTVSLAKAHRRRGLKNRIFSNPPPRKFPRWRVETPPDGGKHGNRNRVCSCVIRSIQATVLVIDLIIANRRFKPSRSSGALYFTRFGVESAFAGCMRFQRQISPITDAETIAVIGN